jgi:sugar phosphate isomerase/epimerase
MPAVSPLLDRPVKCRQARTVHPRLAVSAVSSWRAGFADDLALWERLGVDRVGLSLRKCEEVGLARAARDVRAAGLRVSNVVECGWCEPARAETWPSFRERMRAAVDLLATVGGGVLVLTTGPAGGLEWDAAAAVLAEAWRPVVDAARAAGVRVALEHTGPLRVDLSFVSTLHDALDLAGVLGCDVCVELNSCWAERELARTFTRGADRLAHVQLSDWKVGSLCTPDRVVPGDGDVPLRRILRDLRTCGYGGAFELELVGPQIEAEGYEPAIRRAVARAGELLSAAGFPSP